MDLTNTQTLPALFFVGLLGGVHCVGMCGALVTAFGISDFGPKSTTRLLTLNVGRMFTYTLLGAVAGLVGHGFSQLFAIPVALYIFAQIMLIGLGLYLAGWRSFIPYIEQYGKAGWQALQPVLGKVIPPKTGKQTLFAGMIWGFIPCGLVYSALSSALLSGNPIEGGLAMLAFWLGTLPNLLVIGRFSFVLRKWMQNKMVKKAAGVLVCLLGVYGLSHLWF